MNRTLAGLAVAMGLASAATVWAVPPTITAMTPFGARRGVATELTIVGTHLEGTPELIAPFGFTLAPSPAPDPKASQWKATLTVAPGTAVGVYPIRVRTEGGISNPLVFAVGQLPQVSEAEDNGSFETAQPISVPAVVEGQAAGNDVDYFRFPGKKGQRIAVDAHCARIGSGVDPTIRLTTAAQAYVASADDSPGLLTDARLVATLPEDTDYVIELSDSRYQGGGRPIYRLVVGAVPLAEEIYPIGGRRGETIGLEVRGGTLPGVRIAAATLDPSSSIESTPIRVSDPTLDPSGTSLDVESLTPLILGEIPEVREAAVPEAEPVRAAAPVALNGRIDPAGDEDRFVLAVTPGQKLRIEVDASDHGSALDGMLQVLGAKGAVLALADDTAPPSPGQGKKPSAIASPDPTLDFTVPAGLNEVTLAFRDLESRGGTGFAYRIRVVPATDSFEVVLDDPQVSIPRGGTAAVGVSVVRKGYLGAIHLTVPSPPDGVSVRPGTIAAGQQVGSLTLSATADASFGVVPLRVVGEGPGPNGPITATARKLVVFASQGALATSKITQDGLVIAPASPTPITLKAPETPVEVAQGFGGTVPIEVIRTKDKGADAALSIASLPLPPGLSLAEAKITEKKEEGSVVINAAPEAALGTSTIALLAKGKFEGGEQTIAAPEIVLNVVRPAALELAVPRIEVQAGESVEVKGKIVRKGTFREEVTVKLDKLPSGLKAEPVRVAPDQSEFTVKLESNAKVAAADAKVEVALVLQVAKKDYPVPPVPLAVKVNAPK